MSTGVDVCVVVDVLVGGVCHVLVGLAELLVVCFFLCLLDAELAGSGELVVGLWGFVGLEICV